MTLFMPPIQRKKKVDDKYCPDSFRVISEDAISDHPKFKSLPYRASFEPRTPTPKAFKVEGVESPQSWLTQPLKSTRVLPKVLPDYRGNKPQPLSCGFLDKNVRYLNEPICNVYTKPVQHREKDWWPSRPNPGDLVVPPYAEDTSYRTSYSCKHGERVTGSGRHTAHLDRDAANGIVPVNYMDEKNGEKRFFKEALSYEHMYNSRIDPNYPIRGKRHGSFVWNRMDPISQKKFVEYYQKLDVEERKFEEMKALKSAQSVKSNPCIEISNKVSPTAFTSAKLISENKDNCNENAAKDNSSSPTEKNAECKESKKNPKTSDNETIETKPKTETENKSEDKEEK